MIETPFKCVKCMRQAQARFECHRCMEMYCSLDCQYQDWPHHKTVCFPIPNLLPVDTNWMQGSAAPPRLGLSNLESAICAPGKPVYGGPLTCQNVSTSPPNNPKAASFRASDRTIKFNLSRIRKIAIPTSLRQLNSLLTDDIVQTSEKPNEPLTNPFDSPSANFENYPGLQGPKVIPQPAPQQTMVAKSVVVTSTAKWLNRRRMSMVPARSIASAVSQPATLPPSPVVPATLPVAAVEPSLPKTKPNWTRPFPIEEGKLIKVVVQYCCPETHDTFWVMLSELETECNKLLMGINRGVETSLRCQPSDIHLNQLYAAPFEDIYYRAVCIEPLNAINEVKFRLVDYGNEFYANLKDVKKPIPLMCNLHAFAFKIQFNAKRVGDLTIGTVLSIIVSSPDMDGVYSVMEEVVSPTLPTPVSEAIPSPAPVVTLPATPQSAEQPFSMANIEVVPIPLNVKTKLYLWDLSDINEGIITAGIYNVEMIKRIEQHMCSEMNAYCKGLKIKEYVPQVGELCLAIFDSDSNWYRALCLEEETDEGIELLYVDYGNITNTSRKNVRPITQKFLIPTLANTCHVSGVPDKLPADKIRQQLLSNPIFEIDSAERVEDGEYKIYLSDFQ